MTAPLPPADLTPAQQRALLAALWAAWNRTESCVRLGRALKDAWPRAAAGGDGDHTKDTTP